MAILRSVKGSKERKRTAGNRKKTADNRVSKARKALDDIRAVRAKREARIKELQGSLGAISEAEAAEIRIEINTIENNL